MNIFKQSNLLDKIHSRFNFLNYSFSGSDFFDEYIISTIRLSLEIDDIVSALLYTESEYDDEGGFYNAYYFHNIKLRNGIEIDSGHTWELPEGMTEEEAFKSLAKGVAQDATSLEEAVSEICDALYDLICCSMDFYGSEFYERNFEYSGPTTDNSITGLEHAMFYIDSLKKEIQNEVKLIFEHDLLQGDIVQKLHNSTKQPKEDLLKLFPMKLKKNDAGAYEVTSIAESDLELSLEDVNEIVSKLNFYGMEEYLEDEITLELEE